MTDALYEKYSGKVGGGERLTAVEIRELAGTHDILTLGMLADEARRRAHAARVTFARVACCPFDKPLAEAVPLAAREVRLTGAPPSVDVAASAVHAAKAVAGDRAVSGFSLRDLHALAAASSQPLVALLERLRDEGLEMVAEVPVDRLASPESDVEALARAGYERVRLTMDRPPLEDRVALLLRAAELCARFAVVRVVNPLPMSLPALRPTTGYEDVKMVALARLACPPGVVVQVDWLRYGPKLAQVALTFGANDVDNVPPSDDAPDGRRRAPLEEVRRNIEAAGFTPVERDGRSFHS